jgi:HEAT repeat protein
LKEAVKRLSVVFAWLVWLLCSLPVPAQEASPDLKSAIDHLGDLDFPARMGAARTVRRVAAPQAVPALTAAALKHPDEYVRFRALVLLTGFNDPSTDETMRALLRDRNDRVREVVYGWYERHPDPAMVPTLIAALDTEQAEFVRPALVSALAALGDNAQVRTTLIREVGRGLDFFRGAVIEALGEHRAGYAVDAVSAVVRVDGPLQDDAAIALGRIGDRRALTVLAEVAKPTPDAALAIRAARCLLGESCPEHIETLSAALRAPESRDEVVRAAAMGLSAMGRVGHTPAIAALVTAGAAKNDRVREEAALALAAAALGTPARLLSWFDAAGEAERSSAVELLRDGFDRLEEDLAEEAFFAAARAEYWKAAEGSATRSVAAMLIDKLEF